MSKSITFRANLMDNNAGRNSLLKEVHGVNGSPKSLAPGFPDLHDQYNQMGIKYIRIHDCYGIGDLDNFHDPSRQNNQNQFILNVPDSQQSSAKTFIAALANKRSIFPNAAIGMRNNSLSQALSNPNYAPTDAYLRDILNNQPEVNPGNIQRDIMFRIGRSLDGGQETPVNFDIYASLAAELVKRYSRDYASIGLPRQITYWEVWNEPDLTAFWNSTDKQKYYDFYEKIVRAIKQIDPSIKVGGAAVATGYNPGGAYTDQFLSFCQSRNVPLDFYSWHGYGNVTSDPQSIIDIGNQVQTSLNRYGFGSIESICSEWNVSPFPTKNVQSKVQSAKNAAFVASTFMYMQYTKVDKSHYYRGDACTFGLFNDQNNPSSPGYKNFCTYTGQAFNLFNRMFETPYILSSNKDFTSGITALAGKNSQGNKIKILVANFKVDQNFPRGETPPTESPMYQQYYMDANRTIEQLNDDWSKNAWFGGVDPNSMNPQNSVQQNQTLPQLPVYGRLNARPRIYTESDRGVNIQLQGLTVKNYKLTAYRIKEYGSLDKFTPPEVTSQVAISFSNNTLVLSDSGATSSTVTLYEIDIEEGTTPPPPTGQSESFTSGPFSFRSVDLGNILANSNTTVNIGDVLKITVRSNKGGKIWYGPNIGYQRSFRVNSLSNSPDGRTGVVNITMLQAGKLTNLVHGGYIVYQFPANNNVTQGGYFAGEIEIIK